MRPNFAALGILALMPLPALAHHPMGGALPSTLWQGFASGIGHPMIGLDHLAFLLAAGVLAAGLERQAALRAVIGFLIAGVAGVLLHLNAIDIGPVEMIVAASALVAGTVLLLRGAKPLRATRLLPAGFALAGLFHGHAFAEAVVGAEEAPILAYLAGLAIIQGLLMLSAMALTQKLGATHWVRPATGALASLAGAVFLVATLFF
jgi:urease accessory protein